MEMEPVVWKGDFSGLRSCTLHVNKALRGGCLVAVRFFSKLEGVSRLSNGNPGVNVFIRWAKLLVASTNFTI